jgi:hypothetical protein
MSHIIGHGRYARETYPERGRGGSGGVLQVGYDQPIEALEVAPAALAPFPRDLAGNPLRVALPGVTPGNTLEVDLRFNVKGTMSDYSADFDFAVIAAVAFDGSTTYPGTFQVILNSAASESTLLEDDSVHSLSSLAAVEIPVGATTAAVVVIFTTTQLIRVDGVADVFANSEFLSATLKVSEIAQSATAQLGPGDLFP